MIWCEARGVGCPGTAAAELVMKPKAANLPRINVKTGAAKLKKVRAETVLALLSGFLSKPKDRSRTKRVRAGPNSANVAAHYKHVSGGISCWYEMCNVQTCRQSNTYLRQGRGNGCSTETHVQSIHQQKIANNIDHGRIDGCNHWRHGIFGSQT